MRHARRQPGKAARVFVWSLLSAGLARAQETPTFIERELPVMVSPIDRMTEAGPMRGWSATVDLSDPRIDVVVSDIDGDADLDDADVKLVERAEVVLTPADSFVNRTGVALAFNANFFAWMDDGTGKKTQADLIGLSVSDGVVISGSRAFGDAPSDPVLLFDRAGLSSVTRVPGEPGTPMGDSWDGVAGIGGSDTDATPGTLLVENGQNLGGTARVQPLNRHPRTATGVSADGRTLYVVVIDGRQIGHSVGATLPEMADLLIEMGADDAVALDGGGSSAFVARAEFADETFRGRADGNGDGWVTNRPSDGRFRATGNHVGIRVAGMEGMSELPAYVPGTADMFAEVEDSPGGAGVGSDESTVSKQESP